jgi:bla regulator protein BlaR1
MSTFFSYFLIATLFSSFGIAFILFVKKILKKHTSARWQYNLGLLYFALLAVPFIPCNFFASLNIWEWENPLRLDRISNASTTITADGEAEVVYGADLFQDFAIDVSHHDSKYFSLVFMGIWIVGIIIFTVIMLSCNRRLQLIKESVKPVENKETLSLFSQCKSEIGVKGKILLGSSVMVKTPMTVNLIFKPIM